MDFHPSVINLLKRVHLPDSIQDDLLKILPSDSAETLQKCGTRTLATLTCPETQKKFICCDFNHFQNSFRSPYSNIYVPAISAPTPSKTLRDLEIKALQMFEDYTNSFYKNGISSVYIKETSDRSYAMCFCIKKTTKKGETDLVHVVDLLYDGHNKIIFKLFTKFLLITQDGEQELKVSTAKTIEEPANRQDVNHKEIDHIIKMIENVGGQLKRAALNFVQSKPIQVMQLCRFIPSQQERARDQQLLRSVWSDKSLHEQEKLRNSLTS